jgi:phage gp37-like protein
VAYSGNPLTVEPPESIEALSPELYAYLRELNKTLHENYERQEAGAATFPADRFLTRYAKQEYPLGSEGRFVHADYGVLVGIFVRFADAALGVATPVGWDKTQFGKGFVTKEFAKSESVLFVGFDLSNGPGEYGWALSQGILPATLGVTGVSTNRFLEWTVAGMETTPVATGVRVAVEFTGGTAPIGSILLKRSNAADGTSGVEDDLTSLLNRIGTVEGNVATLNEDFAGVIPLQDEMLIIQQKLDRVNQSVTVVNRLIAEFSPDGVLLEQQQILSATRQYFEVTAGIADNVNGVLQSVTILANSTLMNRDIAKSWSDQSGIYSSVSSERAGEASLKAVESGVSAEASFNYKEEARVYRDAAGNSAAEASSSAAIAAAVTQGAKGLTGNAYFVSGFNGWIQNVGVWTYNNAVLGGNYVQSQIGANSELKYAHAVPVTTTRNYRLHVRWDVVGASIVNYWGLECLNNAGVSLGRLYLSGSGATQTVNTNYEINLPITGTITPPGSAPWIIVDSQFLAGTVSVRPFFIGNLNGVAAGYVRIKEFWFEDITDAAVASAAVVTEATVRANADSAMATQITTLNAYFVGFTGTVQSAITSEATTRASADSAMATQIGTLNAYFAGFSGTVQSAITTEATTRANADSTMAGQITTLNAYFVGFTGTVQSAITSEATTRANADTSLTTQITTAKSSFGATKGLTPNAQFTSGLDMWTVPVGSWTAVGNPGNRAVRSGAGLQSMLDSQARIAIRAGRKYRVHLRLSVNTVTQETYFGISCFDQLGVDLGNVYSASMPASVTAGFHSFTYEFTTDGTATGVNSYGTTPITNTTQVTPTVLVNWGALATRVSDVYELWMEDITDSSANSASITAEATTRANADSAISSTVTTLSTTVSGHTSTLTTYGTSISGLQAKYGVTIDINGYVSGFQLNSGGSTSDFIINANNFQITKPGGGERTEYSNGAWKLFNSSGVMVGLFGNLAEWVP